MHPSTLSNHCYVQLASARWRTGSVTNSGSGSRSPHAIPLPNPATYPEPMEPQLSTYLSADLLLRVPAFAEELTASPAGASGLGPGGAFPFVAFISNY